MGSKSKNTDQTPYVRFHDLELFTNYFSEKLGTGKRGEVFKGKDKNEKEIAVKIPLGRPNGNAEKEFYWEFKSLLMLKHPNIIQLVAYCNETERKYNRSTRRFDETAHPGLCYEYAAKGCLGDYIYDQGRQPLDWDILYKIIMGICEGLNYLHHNRPGSCIFHLDLQPKNILLTDSMVPKLSGFGMFSMYKDGLGKTSEIALGTPRYSPPEYTERREVSKEFDIYSLGATIIETVAGPETYENVNDCSHRDIIDHVRKIWRDREQYCEQVNACISIALRCLNHDNLTRPDIKDIISELKKSSSRKTTKKNASEYAKYSGEAKFASSSNKLHGRYPVTEIDLQWQKLTQEFKTSLTTGGNQNTYSDDEAKEEDTRDNVEQEAYSEEEVGDAIRTKTLPMGGLPSVLSVDVHPVKQWVMTSHRGGQVCLWDYTMIEGSTLELMVKVSDKAVPVAKFIDEEFFVAGDDDGTIYVHNYRVDRQIRKFRAHDGCIQCVAIHPSRRCMLSAASDGVKGRLQLWDGDNHWERSQILPRNQESVRHMVFNPLNPDEFAIAYGNGVIQFRSINSNSKPVMLRVISRCLFFVDYITLDDRQYLITAAEDGVAKIWEADTHTCVGQLEVKEGFLSASCYPENLVLIASSKDGYVHQWNVSTNSEAKIWIGFETQAVRYINKTRFVAGGEQEIAILYTEIP